MVVKKTIFSGLKSWKRVSRGKDGRRSHNGGTEEGVSQEGIRGSKRPE